VAFALAAGSIAAVAALEQTAGAGAARADTSTASALYVDIGAKYCTDAGPGAQGAPFCTLQHAADVATPGQTIIASEVTGGGWQDVRFTHSGEPGAPITVKYSGIGQKPQLVYGNRTLPLVFDNVHDIRVSGLDIQSGPGDGIDVIGSRDITIDSASVDMTALGAGITPDRAGISVDGGSSGITISRSGIVGGPADGIRVSAGASNITITTNMIDQLYDDTPVSVTGASGVALTSNTLLGYCHDAAVLTGTSSATIENNVFRTSTETICPSATLTGLSVDAAAAAAHSDYNFFPYRSGSTPYSWAGTSYSDAPTFTAATGQGAHDTVITTQAGTLPAGQSPWIDSADCTAPGELATDWLGNPHADDPQVPNTGVGTCYADRGAWEQEDELSFSAAVSQSAQTTDGTVTVQLSNAPATSTGTLAWNEPVTYTADWGDGTPVTTIASNGTGTHQYATAGTYLITLTATDTGGSASTVQRVVSAYTATPPAVTLSATTRSGAGAITPDEATFTIGISPITNAWELSSTTIDFGGLGGVSGGGGGASIAPGTTFTYAYQSPGTYTATLTGTDALGRTSTATLKVTVGDLIRLMAPTRDDAHTIPAHGTIVLSPHRLQMSQPTDRAALVTITVTSATKPGYVTVYPLGTTRPGQAAVEFAAGQQASNVALAIPSAYAAFYNGSAAPITVMITTIGTEAGWSQAADTYAPVTPAPVLPTTKVAGNGHVSFAVAGSHGVPANAAAVVLDVTASGGTTAGHFTSYPERLPQQQQQGAYWSRGQTVTGLAVVPVNGMASLQNVGSGSVGFTAQLIGYLAANNGGGQAFVPADRARVLDVTLAGKHGVTLTVTGKDSVPSGAGAVLANLTATGASTAGSITAYADGTARPGVISLSYSRGQTDTNADIVGTGTDGAIDLYNNGTQPVTIVVDLIGSFYAEPG
jgi:PKD repeat protein